VGQTWPFLKNNKVHEYTAISGSKHGMASKPSSVAPHKKPTSKNALNSMTNYDKLKDVFFSDDTLIDTFKVICTNANGYQYDTLTSIVTQLCISQVQIKFTEQGFVPFEQCPLLIIPYSCMTKRQILVIKQIVSDMATQLTQFKVSNMMGGGVSITSFEAPTHIIDPGDVLFTLYILLKMHCVKSKTSHDLIYNVIVQRMVCNINISHVHIQRARDKIKAFMHDKGVGSGK